MEEAQGERNIDEPYDPECKGFYNFETQYQDGLKYQTNRYHDRHHPHQRRHQDLHLFDGHGQLPPNPISHQYVLSQYHPHHGGEVSFYVEDNCMYVETKGVDGLGTAQELTRFKCYKDTKVNYLEVHF